MARTKYKFNPVTLEYEQVKTPLWIRLMKVVGFMSASAVFGLILVLLSFQFLDSPNEKRLRRQIKEYERQVAMLNDKTTDLEKVLASLENRDEQIYREIFGASMPDELRQAGIGGTNKYKYLKQLEGMDQAAELHEKLDKLGSKMYVQSKSFDQLDKLAKSKAKMLASLPAIQPVANKELTRIASGFGYRIDPIYKTRKFHKGLDFTCPVGAEIHATGDGKVIKVTKKRWGYGYHIIIDHGFGYQTLYAHLSDFKVKVGQKVKRGQVIGLVGNTGKSTGPHLHYEVHYKGNAVNPARYFYNDLSEEDYEKVIELSMHSNQSFD
jgi:murein DD-endopeptidase MepM/ murein hydrolase activator NlpD